MIQFLIVADLRTGSTLLSTSLDSHPEVRCYGEMFHPADLPDNQLAAQSRYELGGGELVRRAFDVQGKRAIGFRAMTFLPLPSEPQWADSWDALAAIDDLRVIYLTRRDRLAQYASMLIAHRTGAYHPSPDDPVLKPENRLTVEVDAAEYRRWTREREELLNLRRAQLRGKPSLELDYETLTADWSKVMRSVQEFIGVTPLALVQGKQKQEARPLAEVISNYHSLRL